MATSIPDVRALKHLAWQGFRSGPVPSTFTRLRSCIVPAEITEAKKKICVFTVACQKNLGSVGQDYFFYFLLLSAKPESDSGISFSKFSVSRHLLKLFYDGLCSFSTIFALNFDKKLAVE